MKHSKGIFFEPTSVPSLRPSRTPAEYAAMAVFLASDHAQNITGQTINIDGGQVMHA